MLIVADGAPGLIKAVEGDGRSLRQPAVLRGGDTRPSMPALLAVCEAASGAERVAGIVLPLIAAILYVVLIGAAFKGAAPAEKWRLGIVALLCAAVGAALTVTSDADEIGPRTVVGLLVVGAIARFARGAHPGLWRFLLVGVFAGATVLIWGVGLFVFVLSASGECLG